MRLRILVLVLLACAFSLIVARRTGESPPLRELSSPSGVLDSARVPSRPVPPSFFGMAVIEPEHWPLVPFGALKGTGVSWRSLEPQRGQFDWARLDRWVELARRHGMDLLYTSEGVPQWAAADRKSCREAYAGAAELACSSGVANLKDWDDFATALVRRYKGKIRIYQLWNEPDQSFTGSLSELVQLTQHMHDIIRRLDTQATIVTPAAVRADWMAAYWAGGGVTDVDVVGLHSYPPRSSPTPESLGPKKTEPLRALMSQYGLAKKELWDTEGSWGDPSSGVNTPDQQAAFVARFFLLHWSNGYGRFYWYAWDDNELWGTLWDPKKGPLAAAEAYEQVYRWMVGARMNQPCSEQPDATWTCGFTRPGGYRALAIWNPAGRKGLAPPRGYVKYRDLSGHTFPIKGAIVVDARPILLEAPLTRGASAGGVPQ